jgi:3'(2'), 5'-bisphosphate nucleotidase
MDNKRELKAMIRAAYGAETWIRKVYATDFAVETKSDESPVTAADKGADRMIREELHAEFPSYGFLTEESKDDKKRLSMRDVFIVDPVDGTKEFVDRNDEFCTNIALCRDHEIIVGVINVPMRNVLFYAVKGEGAYKLERGKKPVRIHVSDRLGSHLRVLASRHFLNDEEKALFDRHKDAFESVTECGAALKLCLIAEGKAEITYRIKGSTKEWDTAAGDLIVREAGGVFLKPDGTRYAYNRDDVYNRDGYVAANSERNILV